MSSKNDPYFDNYMPEILKIGMAHENPGKTT